MTPGQNCGCFSWTTQCMRVPRLTAPEVAAAVCPSATWFWIALAGLGIGLLTARGK